MVKTKVYEQIQTILNRVERFPENIGLLLKDPKSEDARHKLIGITIEDFNRYSLLRTDLANEVDLNMSKSLRPAQELTYLENLESLVEYISDIYKTVEKQDWDDRIQTRLQITFGPLNGNSYRLSSVDKKLIAELIESIRVCCYEFNNGCEQIAKTVQQSWFIQKHSSKFPYINSYILDESQVEDSVPLNDSSPSVQTSETQPHSPIVNSDSNVTQLTSLESHYSWKGDKSDLAELVWALAKSGRIGDMITGQPATQREITQHFETLFGLTLDVPGLMKGRMKTYKATSDGNTFTKTLSDLVIERAASS